MSSRATGKEAARARAAEMRAAAARAERRRNLLVASAVVAAVLVLVGALVVAKLAGAGGGDTSSDGPSAAATLPAGVVTKVTSVPPSTLDEVGAGTAQGSPKQVTAPALTADGKPRVLYVGAEYCPFCAAERWPVVVALSRFGTWSALGATESAGNDVFPNTQTLSFHGATYTSDYLSFTGVETRSNKVQGGQYAPLDKLSAADQKLFDTYDRPPYTDGSAGGIPFIDIGGTWVSSGASYTPDVLKGMSRSQIAGALADPKSDVALAVGGTANKLAAAICDATGGKPADVCTSPGVRAAKDALTSGGE